jgi:hypothetical protein
VVANNPGGVNSFNHFSQEPAYGQVSQADRLKKAYPVPGVPDAGKQAQRRATQGGGRPPQAGAAPQAAPAPQGQVPPQQFAAMAWADIAAIPEASPLIKQIAARLSGQG